MLTTALGPGSVIGILGGGQLGRMTALAAARLGYRCHVYTPEADSPASQVTDRVTVAEFGDSEALAAFAGAVDVVTYEFENIPLASVRLLEERVPVRPGAALLAVSQHRVREKEFAASNRVPVARWRHVTDRTTLANAAGAIGFPAVLKTSRFGYDGKGQAVLRAPEDLEPAWSALGTDDAILEAFVGFEREVSVIVARGLDGRPVPYCVVENRHENHILDTTIAPACVPAEVSAAACRIAVTLAEASGLVGVLAVEMFLLVDGSLLMNELAPRPHNSGHWTIDGAATSQFEQLVRTVTGHAPGPADLLHPTVMKNLIGEAADSWADVLAEPGARLHLYGKSETRPGRKMGHVNRVARTA